jgi:hypothetical protein
MRRSIVFVRFGHVPEFLVQFDGSAANSQTQLLTMSGSRPERGMPEGGFRAYDQLPSGMVGPVDDDPVKPAMLERRA